MEELIVLEDSSKSNFGGGQRVTLDFIRSALNYFDCIKVIDSTYFKKTIFTSKINSLNIELYNILGSGYISKRSTSSYSISLKELALYPFVLLFNYLLLLNFVRRNSIAKTYYVATKKGLLLALLVAKKNEKILFHIHNSNSTNFLGKVFKLLMRNPKIVNIAVSHYVKQTYNISNIKVVYNGVDSQEVFFRNFNTTKKIKVAFVGSLVKWKGVNYLLEALEFLDELEVEIHVIGNGNLKDELLTKYGADNRIFFRGFIDDIPKLLNEEIDILCLPSVDAEACPMSILEAFSCGIPVVTTNIGGQAELVKFGGGIVVNPNSSIELANAIKLISKDLSNFSTMAKKVSVNYTLKQFDKSFDEIFSELGK